VRYLIERHLSVFSRKRVGLALIASPSLGSKWANIASAAARYYNNRLAQQLRWDNDALRDLDGRFRDLTSALGISRFILVGHSYGGFVAQDFALRFSNRLSGLVLSCTAATLSSSATRNPLGGTSAQQTAFGQLFVGVSSDQHLKATWEAAVPLYYKNAVVPASVSLAELGARTIYSAAGYTRGNEILAGFDTTSRLHEISVPTMVQYGAGDIWRFGDTDLIARNIPDSLLQYFATSGHWPFQEQPEEFISGLRGFAARVRG
jgi:proline iminopeptidase